MVLTREHFLSKIVHNFRLRLALQEYIDELKSLYGDKAPSYSIVKNLFNEFNRGRSSLKDEFREGPPAVVPDNIDAVHELIMQDHHVTYPEIELSLGISSTNLPIAQKNVLVDW